MLPPPLQPAASALDWRPPQPIRLTFEGVEIDLLQRRLWVDGMERACQPRVFQLLELFCKAPGRALSRQALFEGLWGSAEFRSDEALSQLVFKVRQALGPYGEQLVTLRGHGHRLDAQVVATFEPPIPVPDAPLAKAEGEDDVVPAAPATWHNEEAAAELDLPGTRTEGAGTSPPWRSRYGLAAAGTLALALALAVSVWAARRDPLLDRGYGLRAGDLGASRSETGEVVASALAANRLGQRKKARDLLAAAAASDPATPVPDLILTDWSLREESGGEAARHFAVARQRLGPHPSAYLDRFAQVVDPARRRSDAGYLSAAAALLELRPDAWSFRLRRAHTFLLRNQRRAALAEMQQVHIEALDDFRLAFVLADRASLGDPRGARVALAAARSVAGNPYVAYVRGRIAYTERDYRAARRWFDSAVGAPPSEERSILVSAASLGAIAASGQLGEWSDARSRLARLLAEGKDEADRGAEQAALILAAQVDLLAGDRDGTGAALAQLWKAVEGDFEARTHLELYTLRLLGSGGLPPLAPPPADSYVNRGSASLLAARRALLAGDRRRAESLLLRARLEGVLETVVAEEALLLAADLGQTVALPPRLDPPLPEIRQASWWALRARLARPARALHGPLSDDRLSSGE